MTDDEILIVQRELTKLEGIFGEPTGVTGVAGLKKLLEFGEIDPSDVIVIPITGTGFKDMKIIENQTIKAPIIPPTLEALEKEL